MKGFVIMNKMTYVAGLVLVGMSQNLFSAEVIKADVAKETSTNQARYDKAYHAITEMVKQRNELKKELIALKNRLRQVFPSTQGEIGGQLEELAALRDKLKQLNPQQASQADLIKEMQSVIDKIKMHDHMVDLMTTILPDSVQLTEKPSDKEMALQQRIQLLVNKYTDSVKESEKLVKQVDVKNDELTKLRKAHDELEHLLIELVNYATESAK